jgi:hypothetical protein
VPANISAMPISELMFGKKSAIHHGVWDCQSMSGGLPVEKYPYNHRAIPATVKLHPTIAGLLKFRSLVSVQIAGLGWQLAISLDETADSRSQISVIIEDRT